ncbi:MAG: hypothetical protein CSB06_03795 [Bacteroidia bacterium]|nr:MAG: hypothetical protein CSB06_03795 [Bacteroidia bacterium]
MQYPLIKSSDYNLYIPKYSIHIKKAVFIDINSIHIIFQHNIENIDDLYLFDYKDRPVKFEIEIKNKREYILKSTFIPPFIYYISFMEDVIDVIISSEVNGVIDEVFYFPGMKLGVERSLNYITVRFWCPTAGKVELLLFDKYQRPLEHSYPTQLKLKEHGYWVLKLPIPITNQDIIYYQYRISTGTKIYIALDPYAISMAPFDPTLYGDNIGKGLLSDIDNICNSKLIIKLLAQKGYHNIDSIPNDFSFSGEDNHNYYLAVPENFKKSYSNAQYIQSTADIIAYELNIRDFTIEPGTISEDKSGTFLGLIEKIPYLKQLGITHVQLMPVNKAYTQKEMNRSYSGKDTKKSFYNWGYDPLNFFTLEGRYSTSPEIPHCRIKEFRMMIQALHDAGIGIILDVVLNHTFALHTLEYAAPGCWLRSEKSGYISDKTGAGFTIESRRKQVRSFIIDVLCFYIEKYHIDGFRFDLMSFLDKETLIEIRKQAGKCYNPDNIYELILQGEAWNFTDIPEEEAITKNDLIYGENIGYFNDSFRDSVAGNIPVHGFIQGNTYYTPVLASAITGGLYNYDGFIPFRKNIFYDSYHSFASSPEECLNYISIHDGLTLWDKINLSIKDDTKKIRLQYIKFAYAILLTSQGRVILQSGDEILRTKPLASFDKEKHRAITSDRIDKEEDTVYFHENSYQSPDYTNQIRWSRLNNEYQTFSHSLLNYVQELIKIRKKYTAFHLPDAQSIQKSLQFLSPEYTSGSQKQIHTFHSTYLTGFTIEFIHAPKNSVYYLTGEIHKKEANPKTNPYRIAFDAEGKGSITFTSEDIKNFDLKKWDKSRNLNFKLVHTSGEWDSSPLSYTSSGHNSISPECISPTGKITIDLSKTDDKHIYNDTTANTRYIAYILTMTDYTLYVIHNTQDTNFILPLDRDIPEGKYKILIDRDQANITGIKKSCIQVSGKYIEVLPKSTGVILVTS